MKRECKMYYFKLLLCECKFAAFSYLLEEIGGKKARKCVLYAPDVFIEVILKHDSLIGLE